MIEFLKKCEDEKNMSITRKLLSVLFVSRKLPLNLYKHAFICNYIYY